jgi:hypothetical protein
MRIDRSTWTFVCIVAFIILMTVVVGAGFVYAVLTGN